MLNLIHADLYKLLKSKAIYICLLIVCVGATAIAIVSHLITKGEISTKVMGQASGLGDIVLISILGAFIAGIYFCGDFENKTIHDAVSFGLGRGKVILSKAMVFFFIIFLMTIPYAVVTIIAFSTEKEFATPFVASVFLDILTNASTTPLNVSSVIKIIAISFIAVFVYVARLSICVLLGFLIRKQALVVSIGIGAPLLGDLMVGLGDNTKIVKEILSYTPFSIGYKTITLDSSVTDFIKAIIICVLYITIMLYITYATFRKSEIK